MPVPHDTFLVNHHCFPCGTSEHHHWLACDGGAKNSNKQVEQAQRMMPETISPVDQALPLTDLHEIEACSQDLIELQIELENRSKTSLCKVN